MTLLLTLSPMGLTLVSMILFKAHLQNFEVYFRYLEKFSYGAHI